MVLSFFSENSDELMLHAQRRAEVVVVNAATWWGELIY